MPPEVIGGRYRLVRAIGEGGMGTVWLCRDEMLRRDVAVKRVGMLPGESVTDSARAMREARSSAALSHRNVVTVFDVVEEAGAIWLVMEHVPSRSLADIIKEDGPLEPAVVADIGAQVADGLAAAHSAGTMHRDVKPGNILVREDGIAKISDFGIARSAGDPALTQSGFLTGTPSYFSPELARGDSPGAPADVWALGATLYAAVEGRPPYQAQQNPIAVLHDIAQRQPPAPRRADFLEPALLRMMDRDPASRWSMDDARHTLHRLAEQHAPTHPHTQMLAAPAAVSTPTSTPAPESLRESTPDPTPAATSDRTTNAAPRPAPATGNAPTRRGRYAVLLLIALLLVGAGVAYALLRGNPDGDEAGSSGTTPTAAATSETGSDQQSSSDTPSPSRPPTSATPSATPSASASTTTSAAGTLDRAAVTSFLRGYFAEAPGGSATAWSQLGPAEQAQGRASYNRFWRGIQSVGVSDVAPVDGTSSVDVTLTYETTDGRVSTERQRLNLIRSSDGGFLINGDGPIG